MRADCEELRNDHVSHFVCRLAYCRNDELRKWFVTQETRLFYYRLEFYEQDDVLAFLQGKCSLTFEVLDRQHADWRAMLGKIGFNLESFLRRNKDRRLQGGRKLILDWYANEYIKIPFKHALSLISKRNVFVCKGYAYVHLSELTTIARSAFRTKLNAELLRCFRHLSQIMQDPRLHKLLIDLSQHSQIEFNLMEISAPADGSKINLQDLYFYQRRSFPPCMKALFAALVNQSHLKHYGRLQLGLFIKGMGLTLDEALAFWRREFCKKLAADKFESAYAYNVRHMYGREGKRSDYKPWSCTKVLHQ